MASCFKLLCCANAVDNFVDNKAAETLAESKLTDATKQLIRKKLGEDSFLTVVSLKVPGDTEASNQSAPTDADVKTQSVDLGWKKTGSTYEAPWERVRVPNVSKKISDNFTVDILAEDDMLTKFTLEERLEAKLYRSRVVFPLTDLDAVVDDTTAKRLLKDLGYVPGKGLPITYTTDFNMLSDESFSRIFFYGMGCVLMVKQNAVSNSPHGPFVVDMPLHKLKIRSPDKYRSYGARVHFGENQMVTAIYDYEQAKLFQPGQHGWQEAKMLAKTTAFVLVTAREHLIWTHIILSNATTRESTLHLPPNHPIRRLLTVFTFGATEVNINAFNTLIPKTSVLHRSSAFQYSSMTEIFASSFTESNIFQPFAGRSYNSALQQLIDQGKFPYVTEGEEYYEIVRQFVKDWLDRAGSAATDDYATSVP